MKRKFMFLLTAVLCNGLFLACNDTDDTIECIEDFSGVLASAEEKLPGDWMLTAMTADTEIDLTDDETDNPLKDLFAQYEDCQKDASYSFGTNRTYVYRQAQNTADCTNQVTLGGTWQLSDDTLRLVTDCNLSSIALTFAEDDSAFMFTNSFSIADAEGKTIQTNVTFTYTLTVQ
ncbi:DUF5004 domain-containing protein [Zobellia laminariae]|uniref:DUF5004 domain-containing protein n=1 Tax=Zobellia laminariae TaxID=248906 RepID=UPI0026F41F5A|nr:DUF5004 domain-containing protein [Zobellia laminariae]WKX76692.1 DUF5004 domain-containing protein [Zobellia laminariae]